jgi:hypothetical protein
VTVTWFRCRRCSRVWRVEDPVLFKHNAIDSGEHWITHTGGWCKPSGDDRFIELVGDAAAAVEAAWAVGGHAAAQVAVVIWLGSNP